MINCPNCKRKLDNETSSTLSVTFPQNIYYCPKCKKLIKIENKIPVIRPK